MLSEEGGGGEVIARQRMVRSIHRKMGLNASLGLGAIIDEMSRRSGSEGAKTALMAPLPSCLGMPACCAYLPCVAVRICQYTVICRRDAPHRIDGPRALLARRICTWR